MNYTFHPAAEREYLESIVYYESIRAGLGASFLSEFEGVMEKICKTPHRYPIEKEPDIRRVRLKRFPYIVLYREVSDQVQVLAVSHYRRRPSYWFGRL